MAFMHGVETVQVLTGTRPITQVKTAVIGLVGTSSKYTCADQSQWPGPNVPTLVTSLADGIAKFGTEGKDAYSIPAALAAIFAQGAGTVIVVNVSDVTTQNATVTNEAVTLSTTTNQVTLAHAGITSVVVKDTTAATTYTLNTDYTVDVTTGVITRVLTGAITSGQALKVSYAWMNPATNTASDILGSIVSGNRTGAQCWLDSANRLGIKPRILIAPTYNTSTVLTGLEVLAQSLRAIWISDVGSGQTVAQALATRAAAAIFNTASSRAVACYPYLKDGNGVLRPMSSYLAGVIAATDNTYGYWVSPSNQPIQGVASLERAVSFQLNDSTCDANTLNAQGITTAATGYGIGIRAWGNRSLAYPSSTSPTNFLAVQRVQDMLWESVEAATLQFMDMPINQALVDSIRDSVNAFIRELIGRGALIDGSCTFDKSLNPTTQLAAGQLVFSITFLPPTPAERITFQSFIDISLYKSLK